MLTKLVVSLTVAAWAVLGAAGPAAASAPSPSPTLEEPAQQVAGASWIFVAVAVLAAVVILVGLFVVLRRGMRRD